MVAQKPLESGFTSEGRSRLTGYGGVRHENTQNCAHARAKKKGSKRLSLKRALNDKFNGPPACSKRLSFN